MAEPATRRCLASQGGFPAGRSNALRRLANPPRGGFRAAGGPGGMGGTGFAGPLRLFVLLLSKGMSWLLPLGFRPFGLPRCTARQPDAETLSR
jgi:hypothetical protein